MRKKSGEGSWTSDPGTSCVSKREAAIWSHSWRNIEGERLRSENSWFGWSLSSMKFTLRPSVFSQSVAGLVWLPHYLFKWLRSLGGRGTVCTGNLDRIICTNMVNFFVWGAIPVHQLEGEDILWNCCDHKDQEHMFFLCQDKQKNRHTMKIRQITDTWWMRYLESLTYSANSFCVLSYQTWLNDKMFPLKFQWKQNFAIKIRD